MAGAYLESWSRVNFVEAGKKVQAVQAGDEYGWGALDSEDLSRMRLEDCSDC